MSNKNKCMICDHDKFDFIHSLRDDTSRNAFQCNRCGFIQIQPLPTEEEDEEFYKNGLMYGNTLNHSELYKNNLNIAERMRSWSEYQARKLSPFLHEDWKILEIGSAFGWLVEFLHNKGYDIEGLEINGDYRDIYRERTGKELFSFDILEDSKDIREREEAYDCLLLFHVLEHIRNPVGFVNSATKLLKPGGIIYIDVPNNDDYMMKINKEYEAFHYVRAHLSYFSPKTLAKLLKMCNYNNIQIIGNQIYSLENASHWLNNNMPFRDYHQIDMHESLQWINQIYKEGIEKELKSFAIIGIGVK